MESLSRRPSAILIWLALAAGIWAFAVSMTGGFVWELGWLRLSSRNALRPFLVGCALVLSHLYLHGRSGTVEAVATVTRHLTRPSTLAAVAASATFLIGAVLGTHAIGGSDSYGYVSQADLWLRGDVEVEQQFVGELPWPGAALTLIPLGYIPTGHAGNFVPMYAPGFPLTMVPFIAVGGQAAAFLVVPLFGAVAVWLTYQLGRIIGGESTGWGAAVLLLASPAFLFMLVSAPLSDIPALTWWLLAIVSLARYEGRYEYLLVSGLSTSMAILTRPNLAPVAALLPALILLNASSRAIAFGHTVAWLAPALLGPIVLAVLNNALYGSPIRSGYGPIESQFAWAHVWPNVATYSRWLVETQTPFVFCGLVAPLLLRRAGAGRLAIALSSWCLVFVAAIAAGYLSYTVFGAWWFLRFLLPAYPMLLVTAVATVMVLTQRLRKARRVAFLLIIALVSWRGLVFANRELVFSLADGDYRYKEVGDWAKTTLPSNSIVLSFQHSGSVRYYAHLLTLRYDTMDPRWLDKAVMYFSQAGRPVYAILDTWEVETVRKRFSSSSDLSWLSGQPLEVTARGVKVYKVSAATRR